MSAHEVQKITVCGIADIKMGDKVYFHKGRSGQKVSCSIIDIDFPM